MSDKEKSSSPQDVLQVVDQAAVAETYLSDAAKAIMSQRSAEPRKIENDVVVAECVYFAVKVKTEDLAATVEDMCEIANDLVADGSIHSILAPISSIELIPDLDVEKTLVFFYPLIFVDKVDAASTHMYTCRQGFDVLDLTVDANPS